LNVGSWIVPIGLGLFAFGGGILLLVAAIRTHAHMKLIGWRLGIAFVISLADKRLPLSPGWQTVRPRLAAGNGLWFSVHLPSTYWRLLMSVLVE
jgi:hypothetical protein